MKEKGWSKESLAIYWPVWEQRLMCGLLVSSKDPVSHSVQARADRNPFVEMHSKSLFLWCTDNSGLINKALLLNKTVKDVSFNILCAQSV